MKIDNSIVTIDGKTYPAVGFGTYRLTGKVCQKAVLEAIQTGYRIIDTATYYANFESIAQAVNGFDRSQFYLISKVWPDMQAPGDLRRDFQKTIKELNIDYLDAYFIHWPNSKLPIEPTLKAMKELPIRHIGLSNVTTNHLKRALVVGIPISWVQVEMHPHFCDKALLEFCRSHNIGLQAWRPLDEGRIKDDPLLASIGKKYNKSACQVALKWCLQMGAIPLPGSKTLHHIQENFDISTFRLTEEEMESINSRAFRGKRYRLTGKHGFADEFDYSYEECWPKTHS